MKEMTINAVAENLEQVMLFLDEELDRLSCGSRQRFQMEVAVEEIFANIVHYAYAPNIGPVTVRLSADEEEGCLCVTFLDEGIPFDPLKKPEPDVTLPAQERKIGGLGIFMVQKSMDRVSYEYKDGRNQLTLFKKIK